MVGLISRESLSVISVVGTISIGWPLAMRLSGDRPWLGELHRVAVYNRVWRPNDVMIRYADGPATGGRGSLTVAVDARSKFF